MDEKVDGTIEKRNLQSFWKTYARSSDLYLDNTSLGKINNQFKYLNHKFKRLQVSDT